MALTRAQLLAGDSSQGVVLSGEVQGVKQGVGVVISVDGTISFDGTTATGVVRTNNPAAYNAYVWPTLTGVPAADSILRSDGSGNLSWTNNYVLTTSSSGAANLPAGTTATRPPAPLQGQIRFNTENTQLELYTGAAWVSLFTLNTVGLGLTLDNGVIKTSTPIASVPPTVGSAPAQAVVGSTYFDDEDGAIYIYYNDGASSQWVQVIGL